jgi:hypothetical protein
MRRNYLVLVFLLVLLLTTSAFALTADVSVRINGVAPNGTPQMLVGQDNILQFWITNSAKIVGMTLGFELQNSGGLPYSLVTYGNVPNSPSNLLQEHGTSNNFLNTFGAGNLYFAQTGNTLFMGGLAINGSTNPQDRFMSAHLASTLAYSIKIRIPAGQPAGTFCVRPVFVAPAGSWKMDASSNVDEITGLPSGACAPTFQGQATVSPTNPGIDWAHAACFARIELAFICGDANGDATVNISDAVSLIAYIFSGGPAPSPLLAGDANCDSTVNISDAVYLIAYIFSGGTAPCAVCK